MKKLIESEKVGFVGGVRGQEGWDAVRSTWLALRRYQRSWRAQPETHSANYDALMRSGRTEGRGGEKTAIQNGRLPTSWPSGPEFRGFGQFLRGYVRHISYFNELIS
jgi:hypothetical protein